MPQDTDFFRKVMGQFATGVTIATTRSQAGIAGLTVNSFTSVSLDPLLVLICVDIRSQALPFFRAGGVFAVNILAQEQEALSNCFATSSDERYIHFCHANHSYAATGAPILDGVMGFVDTRITAEHPGGDHVIFLGRVEAMGYDGHVFFVPGVSREQSTISTAANALSPASNNGHAPQQPAPLLYYRGQYHHLSNHYQHAHPEIVPASAKRAKEA